VAAPSAQAVETILKNGTILTVTKGTTQNGDLLIKDGKIAAIGKGLKVPAGAKVIDATGKFVMPGIIDAHSHLAIEGGVNDMAEVISPQVNIYDVVNHTDPGIKWALAGGVTAINAMHGSANPIGGLAATLKLRWGRSADEMRFAGAPQQIKFALGENPKRVHADQGVATRLGVAETIRQQFTAAREYMREWDAYNRKKQAGEKAVPPRKDLQLESLAGVLRGEISIQCHSYRADEIEMLMKLSDEFGFKVGTFQHVLEGYRVAPEMAKRGIGASTFSDMWGYKLEAYDGILHNAAAMTTWGVRASINSDSGERIRRLNLDAAKSLRYGGLTEDQCLALVTINPAWQLGVDRQTGSLEVGKDADISVWDAHPLSTYSKCVATLVDGDVYFERKTDGAATFGLAGAPTVQAAAAVEGGRTGRRRAAETVQTVSTGAPAPASPASKPAASSFTPLAIPVTAKPSAPATFAITDARIVTVSGPVIERGTILVEDGRIKAVGASVAVPAGVRVIRASGQTVTPGFINATGSLGLTEISSVEESQDLGERGSLKAHLRAAEAYRTHSAWVGLSRCAGITSSLVSPRGAGWMGQPALMHTAGRTIEEAAVVPEIAQALSLGGGFGPPRGGEGGIGGGDAAQQSTGGATDAITKALTDARDYARQLDAARGGGAAPRDNLTSAALIPVARQERPVIISGSSRSDVERAVTFGSTNKVNVIVSGGREADAAADALNKAGVPVIFTELTGMPMPSDAYDKQFSAPKRLHAAGVKFCIATSDAVNLAQNAAIAAAFGLPREEALKAITLYPAQILGVERDLGSIEPGKIADLLITDGDPLEYRTKIKRVFINGVEAPLVSKHSLLFEEYRKK
jgi:imidazolonepropionase-like amidohydrolase